MIRLAIAAILAAIAFVVGLRALRDALPWDEERLPNVEPEPEDWGGW